MEAREDDWEGGDYPLLPPILLRGPAAFLRLLSVEHAASFPRTSANELVQRPCPPPDGELRRVRLTAQVVRVRSDDIAALIARRTEESCRDADLPEPDRRGGGLGTA